MDDRDTGKEPPKATETGEWLKKTLPYFSTLTRSFLHEDGGDRVRIEYLVNESEPRLRAKVWFGPGAQGMPGHVHGGCIAALCDETLATMAWHAGHPVGTHRLEVEYLRFIPIETEVQVEAWVVEVDGWKVRTACEIRSASSELMAKGTALLIELDPEFLATSRPGGV